MYVEEEDYYNDDEYIYDDIKRKRKIDDADTLRFICQCQNGHVFDYRNRIKLDVKKGWADCQGQCPTCKTTRFSFIGEGYNLYPIKSEYND